MLYHVPHIVLPLCFFQGTASVTPPLELSISRLTRMTRRVPDKKSEFLKALKDEQDADQTEDRDRDKLEDVR